MPTKICQESPLARSGQPTLSIVDILGSHLRTTSSPPGCLYRARYGKGAPPNSARDKCRHLSQHVRASSMTTSIKLCHVQMLQRDAKRNKYLSCSPNSPRILVWSSSSARGQVRQRNSRFGNSSDGSPGIVRLLPISIQPSLPSLPFLLTQQRRVRLQPVDSVASKKELVTPLSCCSDIGGFFITSLNTNNGCLGLSTACRHGQRPSHDSDRQNILNNLTEPLYNTAVRSSPFPRNFTPASRKQNPAGEIFI